MNIYKEALKKLTADLRLKIYVLNNKQKSTGEIAKILGISEYTVLVALNRV